MINATCKYCQQTFSHTGRDPNLDVCRDCWYTGVTYREQYAALIQELQHVNANAGIEHTGGGCFVLSVPLGGAMQHNDEVSWHATYAYLTDSEDWELPDDDGMSDGQRWLVGIYDDRREGDATADTTVEYREGLTLPEAMEYLFAWDALFTIQAEHPDIRSWQALHDEVDANAYLFPAFEAFDGNLPRIGKVEAIIIDRLRAGTLEVK